MGGTGILAPAARALAAGGWRVSVLARGARGAGAVAVDVRDATALAGALDDAIAARGPLELALVYAPAAPGEALATLAARVPGLLVHVLTSRWAAPDAEGSERWAPDGPGRTLRVLLGWTGEAGTTRWHTPDEVSAGVLAALRGARNGATVGRLRPWDERPG